MNKMPHVTEVIHVDSLTVTRCKLIKINDTDMIRSATLCTEIFFRLSLRRLNRFVQDDVYPVRRFLRFRVNNCLTGLRCKDLQKCSYNRS